MSAQDHYPHHAVTGDNPYAMADQLDTFGYSPLGDAAKPHDPDASESKGAWTTSGDPQTSATILRSFGGLKGPQPSKYVPTHAAPEAEQHPPAGVEPPAHTPQPHNQA